MSDAERTHQGGCHCGEVTFAFVAPAQITVQRCNCSICAMTGFLHFIVPAERFQLKTGRENLQKYQFNTKVAQHLFCLKCGVKSYYIPRSNPNGVSININCVDQSSFDQIEIENFDGQNWEENAAKLAHLA